MDIHRSKARSALKNDNLTAICEPIVYKMWDPRHLRILEDSMACYTDSLLFLWTDRSNLIQQNTYYGAKRGTSFHKIHTGAKSEVERQQNIEELAKVVTDGTKQWRNGKNKVLKEPTSCLLSTTNPTEARLPWQVAGYPLSCATAK
jgi:hypothetical protein